MATATTTARGAGRPAGSDRERNLARIFDAALICFSSKGYGGTHFADIAERVGFTRSALYQYFPNKRALYHALLDNIQAEHVGKVELVLADAGDFRTRLRSIQAIFVADHEFDLHRSTFLASVPLEMQRHPELVLEERVSRSVPTRLLTFFQAAIDAGEINPQFSAEDLLVALLGGLLGMSLFQQSTGLGSVARANDAMMAMLDGQFLTS
ncbi:MAG: helix-turn-helix domain-containing protein [Pseudomonadota bacterium]